MKTRYERITDKDLLPLRSVNHYTGKCENALVKAMEALDKNNIPGAAFQIGRCLGVNAKICEDVRMFLIKLDAMGWTNAIDADKLDEITKYYADVKRKSRNYGFVKKFNTLCEGRCEGIAMTLSILGYKIVKDENGGHFAVRKGGAK